MQVEVQVGAWLMHLFMVQFGAWLMHLFMVQVDYKLRHRLMHGSDLLVQVYNGSIILLLLKGGRMGQG